MTLPRLMLVFAVLGAVLGFGVAALAQVPATAPAVTTAPWAEFAAQGPLMALAVWLARELRTAHRDGMEAIRKAIEDMSRELTHNREAIDRLAHREGA